MTNPQMRFKVHIADFLKIYLNRIKEFDESINQYVHSEKFLRLATDSVIKSINILLNEHSDFLVLSFVFPDKNVIDVKEFYSSYKLDVHNVDNLKSALTKHLEYIQAEKFDRILHHNIFYNDKREKTIFLKPSTARKYFPIKYYKNVA